MSARRSRALRALSALLLPACTLVVDPEVGAGLGTSCAFDDQCQGSSCMEGVCAVACGDSNGCPGGTVCAELLSGNGRSCQLPLRAGLVYGGDPDQFDFIRAFDDGRLQTEELPALGYLSTTVVSPVPLASDAADEARDLAQLGHDVVVSTQASHAQEFTQLAGELDGTTVLVYQGPAGGENVVSFDARMYQAHYLAGMAAARTSTTNRLGFVAGAVTPRVIASVNAFALGASFEQAGTIVEVRFLGEPHDTQPKVGGKSRERVFVEEMVLTGCDVIAHNLDNNIPLFTVRDLLIGDGAGPGVEPDIHAIGQNVANACEMFEALPEGATSEEQAAVDGRCVAATFYQWGPLFARVFDDVHRGNDVQGTLFEPILASNTGSVVGFSVDPSIGVATVNKLDDVRGQLADDVGLVFTGPIDGVGCEAPPTCVAAGQVLDDAAITSMCWLVTNVVGPDDITPLLTTGDCAPE